MPTKPLPPYPTPAEVIRTLAQAIASKSATKRLEDAVRAPETDIRKLEGLIDTAIVNPVNRYIGAKAGGTLQRKLRRCLRRYLDTIASVSLEGVPRIEAVALLNGTLFVEYVSDLLINLHEHTEGPSLVALLKGKSALDTAFVWLKETKDGASHLAPTDAASKKAQGDLIWTWRNNKSLPDLQAIQRMIPPSRSAPEDGAPFRTLLLIARGIDWIKKQPGGRAFLQLMVDHMLLGSPDVADRFRQAAAASQKEQVSRFSPMLPAIEKIQHGLMRTSKKPTHAQQITRTALDEAHLASRQIGASFDNRFFLDWHEARWHVLSNDNVSALRRYKDAFEGCLFQGGDNQWEIIKEAMCVAAGQDKPDMVLLKNLKKAAILLRYELPVDVDGAEDPRNKHSDFVAPWEIPYWRDQFDKVFPPVGRFAQSHTERDTRHIGPLFIASQRFAKPDLKRRNRVIKVGDTWQKPIPQLVWFAQQGDVGAVKKLLDAGADVDQLSKSDESALLMAIQLMAPDVNGAKPEAGEAIFDLLRLHRHSVVTLNARTTKKRLTSLIEAVKTGRPDIVRALLDMGADPDLRGDTDLQTPLNTCLKRIASITRPESFFADIGQPPTSIEGLDGVRRHSNGLLGPGLGDIAKQLGATDEQCGACLGVAQRRLKQQMQRHYSPNHLREIALLLIDRGADPNATHQTPIHGYTPLMLAAEMNEGSLFDAMLNAGGDWKKTYDDPKSGKPINCALIAQGFGSTTVLARLRKEFSQVF